MFQFFKFKKIYPFTFKRILILSVVPVFILAGLSVAFVSWDNANKKGLKAKPFFPEKFRMDYSWDEVLSPQIDTWFKKLCTTTRFSGNVLVAKDGKIIYKNFYGYSNYQRKDTMTIKTRFQTASISKIFTSVAILMLKERGLLRLDDPVDKFIKGFPYKGITIKMLLSHRSGLPNYNYFCEIYTDKETVIYNTDVVRLLVDSMPDPYLPPETKFNYSNTNFVLLASVVEQISGQSFENFMRREIFRKAGMKNSIIYVNGKQHRIQNAATGYHYPWTEALTTYQDGVTGDKGLYTTIEDLYLWNIALDNNSLISEETLSEAFKPANPEFRKNWNYGLGWRLSTAIDSSRFVFHTGWWRGFNGYFVKDIKNNALYVVLCNVRNRAMYALLPELTGIIDPVRRQKQLAADSLFKQLKNEKDTLNADIEF
jgi:CubicO group peptidase (beta-lactamase class C family)